MCKLKPGGLNLHFKWGYLRAYKHYRIFKCIYFLPAFTVDLDLRSKWSVSFMWILWTVEIEREKGK